MTDLIEELENYASHLDGLIVKNESPAIITVTKGPTMRDNTRQRLVMVGAASAVLLALVVGVLVSNDSDEAVTADSTPIATTRAGNQTPVDPTVPAVETLEDGAPDQTPVETTTPFSESFVATRSAVLAVADALARGDEAAVLAQFAPNAVLTGRALSGRNARDINASNPRRLDVAAEREFFVVGIRTAIALNSAPTVDSCEGDVTVICEWSAETDLFRPANVNHAVIVTVEVNEQGLITSWDGGQLSSKAAELGFRFANQYLFTIDRDLAGSCMRSDYDGEVCIEFLWTE